MWAGQKLLTMSLCYVWLCISEVLAVTNQDISLHELNCGHDIGGVSCTLHAGVYCNVYTVHSSPRLVPTPVPALAILTHFPILRRTLSWPRRTLTSMQSSFQLTWTSPLASCSCPRTRKVLCLKISAANCKDGGNHWKLSRPVLLLPN